MLAGIALAGTLAAAHAADPSTQIALTGGVTTPQTLKLADLQALPAITQTVSYLSGSTPNTKTYTGASLYSVLEKGGIKTDASVKNDILRKYVIATGTDGYVSVFALGEIHPSFGNRSYLTAYAETIDGVSTPLAADGFARVTAPGDLKGGRYVSNLARLDVRSSASTAVSIGGGRSTSFTVSGDVKQSMSFDTAALEGLAQQTQTVGGVTYTGVSFWDLLNTTVGLATDPNVKNDVLGMYVVATGTDGYQAVFSLGELSPDFGHQADMIALTADGEALTDNGFARLVVPTDVKGGRWVSNLMSIEVFHASPSVVPEPAGLALMLGGLGLVGCSLRRARRQSRSTP
jgi:DMSO/TMAO reductase YedYZ molybdopterin-dependent catalytic subunit